MIKVRPPTRLLLGGALSGSCAGAAWPLLARAAGGGVGLADVALCAGAGALCGLGLVMGVVITLCLLPRLKRLDWRPVDAAVPPV